MGESEPDYLGSFSVGCIKAGKDTHMPRCKQNIDDIGVVLVSFLNCVIICFLERLSSTESSSRLISL